MTKKRDHQKFTVGLALRLLLLAAACCPMSNRCYPAEVTSQAGDIQMTLQTDKSNYGKGDEIDITFTLVNTSQNPLLLQRQQGPVIDITIEPTLVVAASVLKWSEDSPPTPDLRSLELKPSEKYSVRWRVTPADSAPYLIKGRLWIWEQESQIYIPISYDYASP